MKHPTPSDFIVIVNVNETHVSVIFKPSDSYYSFGRLADLDDIARLGLLSPPNEDTRKLATPARIHRKRSHRWRTRWLSRRYASVI
jgi:hypothetical protein